MAPRIVWVVIDREADEFCGQEFEDMATMLSARSGGDPSRAATPEASQSTPAADAAAAAPPSSADRVMVRVVRGVENAVAGSVHIVAASIAGRRRMPGKKAAAAAVELPVAVVIVATSIFVDMGAAAALAESATAVRDYMTAVERGVARDASTFTLPADGCHGAMLSDVRTVFGSSAVIRREPSTPAHTARVAVMLVNFAAATTRVHTGPRSKKEGDTGAAFVVASAAVAGVNFIGTRADSARAVEPLVTYACRKAKDAEELDAASMTEPMTKGKKVDVDWAAAYLRILSEVPTITEPRARCIVAVFPSLHALLEELRLQAPIAPDLNTSAASAVDVLTPKFAALSRAVEPDASARGADRAARHFGVARTIMLINALRTPFDPKTLDAGEAAST